MVRSTEGEGDRVGTLHLFIQCRPDLLRPDPITLTRRDLRADPSHFVDGVYD
jgi:hypothetical protein